MKRYLMAMLLLALASLAQARNVGIFDGAGTCDGCARTIGALFKAMGDRVVYLDEHTLDAARLATLQVYVQPGGSDDIDETLDALSPAQVQAIRRFVQHGGSYLGVCAGAYLAARFSSEKDRTPAYGLIGNAELFPETPDPAPSLLAVRWGDKTRMVYNQSGAHFGTTPARGVRVLARYVDSGRIAAQTSRYGRGKVVLAGPHFEAGLDWYAQDHLDPRHGLNQDLFRTLIGYL